MTEGLTLKVQSMFPNFEKYNKVTKIQRMTRTDKVLQKEMIPTDFYEGSKY